MKYTDTLIFDLDGTLIDSLIDLADSTNSALKFCNLPERSYDEIRSFLGNGSEQLVRRAVPEDASEDKLQECLAYFKIYYSFNSTKHTKPYPGVVKTLENLKRKGFKIGVASNKVDKLVKEICNEYFFGLVDYAQGETKEIPKKPSPEIINRVITELGADKEKTVMIGDSDIDVQTAKNAGIYSIGVLWGYRDERTLNSAGADELVDSPEHLECIL